MHVGYIVRVEAKTREKAYEIYKEICCDENLCWENDDKNGIWDYTYGPKALYDNTDGDDNTYWSDGMTGENETRVYNGITWEEFKNQGISAHRLRYMFQDTAVVGEEGRHAEPISIGTFSNLPDPKEGNGAWVFVVCAHI